MRCAKCCRKFDALSKRLRLLLRLGLLVLRRLSKRNRRSCLGPVAV
jgi:hypothetical protein